MSSTPSSWLRHGLSGQVARPAATGISKPSPRYGLRRLNRTELRRRFCHMAPGLLPFLLWPIPHKDPLSPLLLQIIVGLFLVIIAALFLNWSRIARASVGKEDRMAAILGYAVTVLASILLFPSHIECGFAVLAILAFGDGSATLLGKFARSPKLPWNREKTLAGFIGFFAMAIPMTTLIYWGESNNVMQDGASATVRQAFIVALAGVTAGAVAESLPSRLNDNLRVGLVSAIAVVAAHAAIFGL